MSTRMLRDIVVLAVMATAAAGAQGAFMVETHNSGLANQNYSGNGTVSSDTYPSYSRAVGITAKNAVFGGTGDDIYVFSYTPSPAFCPDVDNVVFAAGTGLSDNNAASGLTGGVPGLYNVYATWRASGNVSDKGAKFTTTGEGEPVVLSAVQQKTINGVIPEGSDSWLKVANGVRLVTGRKYTVTMVANDPASFVSMRASALMWELAQPEVPVADITETDGDTSVEEGGDVDAYTITLKEQPSMAIVVNLKVSEPNQITLNGAENLELTFRPDNWNVAQIVNVVAVQDSLVEPEDSVWVLHMTRVADPNLADPAWDDAYAGLLTVHMRDYDVPDVKIRETDNTTEVSEQGGADSYTAVLLYPPTDNVTVTVTTDGQTLVDVGAGAAQTAQLVFTPVNWGTARTVTVTGAEDDVLEGNHTSVITHTVSSLDGGYEGLEVDDVGVAVDDNECGAWGHLPLDLNHDCVVGLADLVELAASWLECTQPYGDNCQDMR